MQRSDGWGPVESVLRDGFAVNVEGGLEEDGGDENGDGGIGDFTRGEDVLISGAVFAGGLMSGIRNSPGAKRCSRSSPGHTPDADHPETKMELRPTHSFAGEGCGFFRPNQCAR
jgi:hypothetical protein